MRLQFTGLWRHRDFMKLWIGETVSVFGSQVTGLAIPLTAALVLKATALEMGILGAVEMLPFLVLSLFAGVWADRMRRRPILISADLGRAVLLGSVPIFSLLGWLSISYLYVIALLTGIMTVFFDIAYQAYLPSLVDREQLVEGNGKLEVSRSVAQIAGPGLAGWLIQLVTAPIAIIVDAVSFLVSAIFVSFIRKAEPLKTTQPGERRSIRAEIGEGLGVVLGNKVLRSIAGCTSTSNFFGAILQAVFVLYLTRQLNLGAGVLGIIFAVSSIGALIGATLANQAAKRFGVGRTIVFSALISGVGSLFIPLATGPQWLVIAMLIIGQLILTFSGPIYNITQVSLRQAITPHRLQGRMNASMRFIVWGTMPIGSLVGGALGEILGLHTTLYISAVGMMLAFLWVLFSSVRKLQEQPTSIADEPLAVTAN